ncbi:MAG: hypothetical protein N3F66_12610, partial [Spirochaetes bacterium]|nr:hypothetical protein [Spirochaetota bacterium]
ETAYGIYVYNGQRYIAGFYQIDNSGSKYARAALWVDSNNPILYAPEDGSDCAAFSVFVYNNDVYVAGNIEKDKSDNSGTYVQPCYWKNGVRVDLSVPSQAGTDATEISSVGAHAIVVH